jgi:hypothetical protein
MLTFKIKYKKENKNNQKNWGPQWSKNPPPRPSNVTSQLETNKQHRQHCKKWATSTWFIFHIKNPLMIKKRGGDLWPPGVQRERTFPDES